MEPRSRCTFECTYTSQKTKKNKSWKDGVCTCDVMKGFLRVLLYAAEEETTRSGETRLRRKGDPIDSHQLPLQPFEELVDEEIELPLHLLQLTRILPSSSTHQDLPASCRASGGFRASRPSSFASFSSSSSSSAAFSAPPFASRTRSSAPQETLTGDANAQEPLRPRFRGRGGLFSVRARLASERTSPSPGLSSSSIASSSPAVSLPSSFAGGACFSPASAGNARNGRSEDFSTRDSAPSVLSAADAFAHPRQPPGCAYTPELLGEENGPRVDGKRRPFLIPFASRGRDAPPPFEAVPPLREHPDSLAARLEASEFSISQACRPYECLPAEHLDASQLTRCLSQEAAAEKQNAFHAAGSSSLCTTDDALQSSHFLLPHVVKAGTGLAREGASPCGRGRSQEGGRGQPEASAFSGSREDNAAAPNGRGPRTAEDVRDDACERLSAGRDAGRGAGAAPESGRGGGAASAPLSEREELLANVLKSVAAETAADAILREQMPWRRALPSGSAFSPLAFAASCLDASPDGGGVPRDGGGAGHEGESRGTSGRMDGLEGLQDALLFRALFTAHDAAPSPEGGEETRSRQSITLEAAVREREKEDSEKTAPGSRGNQPVKDLPAPSAIPSLLLAANALNKMSANSSSVPPSSIVSASRSSSLAPVARVSSSVSSRPLFSSSSSASSAVAASSPLVSPALACGLSAEDDLLDLLDAPAHFPGCEEARVDAETPAGNLPKPRDAKALVARRAPFFPRRNAPAYLVPYRYSSYTRGALPQLCGNPPAASTASVPRTTDSQDATDAALPDAPPPRVQRPSLQRLFAKRSEASQSPSRRVVGVSGDRSVSSSSAAPPPASALRQPKTSLGPLPPSEPDERLPAFLPIPRFPAPRAGASQLLSLLPLRFAVPRDPEKVSAAVVRQCMRAAAFSSASPSSAAASSVASPAPEARPADRSQRLETYCLRLFNSVALQVHGALVELAAALAPRLYPQGGAPSARSSAAPLPASSPVLLASGLCIQSSSASFIDRAAARTAERLKQRKGLLRQKRKLWAARARARQKRRRLTESQGEEEDDHEEEEDEDAYVEGEYEEDEVADEAKTRYFLDFSKCTVQALSADSAKSAAAAGSKPPLVAASPLQDSLKLLQKSVSRGDIWALTVDDGWDSPSRVLLFRSCWKGLHPRSATVEVELLRLSSASTPSREAISGCLLHPEIAACLSPRWVTQSRAQNRERGTDRPPLSGLLLGNFANEFAAIDGIERLWKITVVALPIRLETFFLASWHLRPKLLRALSPLCRAPFSLQAARKEAQAARPQAEVAASCSLSSASASALADTALSCLSRAVLAVPEPASNAVGDACAEETENAEEEAYHPLFEPISLSIPCREAEAILREAIAPHARRRHKLNVEQQAVLLAVSRWFAYADGRSPFQSLLQRRKLKRKASRAKNDRRERRRRGRNAELNAGKRSHGDASADPGDGAAEADVHGERAHRRARDRGSGAAAAGFTAPRSCAAASSVTDCSWDAFSSSPEQVQAPKDASLETDVGDRAAASESLKHSGAAATVAGRHQETAAAESTSADFCVSGHPLSSPRLCSSASSSSTDSSFAPSASASRSSSQERRSLAPSEDEQKAVAGGEGSEGAARRGRCGLGGSTSPKETRGEQNPTQRAGEDGDEAAKRRQKDAKKKAKRASSEATGERGDTAEERDVETALKLLKCDGRRKNAPPFLLVHGVFGAGKSSLLAAALVTLSRLLEAAKNRSNVLLVCATNTALDSVLLKLRFGCQFTDFARVGRLSEIHPLLLPHAVSSTKDRGLAIQEWRRLLHKLAARDDGRHVAQNGAAHPTSSATSAAAVSSARRSSAAAAGDGLSSFAAPLLPPSARDAPEVDAQRPRAETEGGEDGDGTATPSLHTIAADLLKRIEEGTFPPPMTQWKRCRIFAATCSTAACSDIFSASSSSSSSAFSVAGALSVPFVFLDEATQTPEALLVALLSRFSAIRCLQLGDSKQLPPVVKVAGAPLSGSLFARLLPRLLHCERAEARRRRLAAGDRLQQRAEAASHASPDASLALPRCAGVAARPLEEARPRQRFCSAVLFLRTQYRCHPVIGRLCSRLFYGEHYLKNGVEHAERLPPSPSSLGGPLCCISVRDSRETRDGKSFVNWREASVIATVVRTVLECSFLIEARKRSRNDAETPADTPPASASAPSPALAAAVGASSAASATSIASAAGSSGASSAICPASASRFAFAKRPLRPAEVGVICLYRSQVACIERALRRVLPAAALKDLQVSTVDAFQGAEREMILLSCVRTTAAGSQPCGGWTEPDRGQATTPGGAGAPPKPEGPRGREGRPARGEGDGTASCEGGEKAEDPEALLRLSDDDQEADERRTFDTGKDFINCPKRMNVAFSRAKRQVVVVGHETLFQGHPAWRELWKASCKVFL
ncbi:hypothetical protein BESB_044260 [Besnoitia besnoiti]|uniref:Uncharacterized protein n=1 Tax=Besnoitia besnoiti TaxID=94643 RepID=A0A2A9MGD6_BESBE|nr:hypothetical protein BESB_044260 [Besnoitia besnoiti]PFH36234.1 hypothetical protein BESB_044260 [Besnoitia besnoiti]